jgi:hypothetical protein
VYSQVSHRLNSRNRRALARGPVAIGKRDVTIHRPQCRHHWKKLKLHSAAMEWLCFVIRHRVPDLRQIANYRSGRPGEVVI